MFVLRAGAPLTKVTRLPLRSAGVLDARGRRCSSCLAVVAGIVEEVIEVLRSPILHRKHQHAFLREVGGNAAGADVRLADLQRRHARDVVLAGDDPELGVVELLQHVADADRLRIAGRAASVSGPRDLIGKLDVGRRRACRHRHAAEANEGRETEALPRCSILLLLPWVLRIEIRVEFCGPSDAGFDHLIVDGCGRSIRTGPRRLVSDCEISRPSLKPHHAGLYVY